MEFCEIQKCWEVVEYTLEQQNRPDNMKTLLDDKDWKSQDAKAQYYIKKNIQPEDKTSVRDLQNSSAVWKYLMDKYKQKSKYDLVITQQKVI